MSLQIDPELRARSEKASKPQGRVRSDGPLPLDYFVNSSSWHIGIFGKPRLAYPHRLQKVFKEYFTRMYRFQFLIHIFPITSYILLADVLPLQYKPRVLCLSLHKGCDNLLLAIDTRHQFLLTSQNRKASGYLLMTQ